MVSREIGNLIKISITIYKITAFAANNMKTKNIEKVTMVLAIFLISLSILGYVLLFFIDTSETTERIDTTKQVKNTYY